MKNVFTLLQSILKSVSAKAMLLIFLSFTGGDSVFAVCPSASISYAGTPYCASISSPQGVTLIGTTGGTYSSTGGLTIDPTTGNITPNSSTAGTYTVTYNIPAAGACAAVNATTTVKITADPSLSTISYAGSPFCSTVTTGLVTQTGTSGGTYSSTTGLSFINTSTGKINPSTSTAGTYTVTYSIPASGGCSAFSATTSVSITTLPTASVSYAGAPFCNTVSSPQSVSQTGTSGGTYSSTTGLTINSSTGAITPSTSTHGIYTVTYTIATSGGCSAVNATTSVQITNAPSATISYAANPFCSTVTTGLVTQTGYTGGTYSSTTGLSIVNTSTGKIAPSTSTPGIYTVTYTVAAAGGCSAFSTTASVTISASPSATISYAGAPFCNTVSSPQSVSQTGTSGGTYSSAAGLTINSATGAITPSTSTTGTYTVTYTIAASGGCSGTSATTSVQITNPPSATISYPGGPFCTSLSTAAVTQTGTTGGTYSTTSGLTILNSSTGKIAPSSSTGGTYTVTYTIAAAGGCAAFTATAPVTITTLPSASISYPGSPYCALISSPQNPTHSGSGGGTYSSTTGLSINSSTGAILPSSSTIGNYTVTYTIPSSSGCAAVTTTASLTITSGSATASISYTGTPYCTTVSSRNVTFSGTSGGTYTSTAGLTLNSATGAINPSTSTAGTYTVTYTVPPANGCSGVTANTSIVITALPVATISYAGNPFCQSVSSLQAITHTGSSGGAYSATSGLSIDGSANLTPSANASGSYTVTYTIPAAAGCAAVITTAPVVITTPPVTPTISYSGAPFCTTISTPQSVTQTGASGGTYSSTAGLTLNSATGAITPSTSTGGAYTVTYTVAASGGCSGVSANTSLTITTGPSATISYSGTPFCTSVSSPQSVTQTGTSGGTYSSTVGLSIDGTTGNITPSSSTAGSYTVTYTIAASAGCSSVSANTSVTITTAPVTPTISYSGTPFCTSVSTPQSVTQTGTSGGTYGSTAGLSIDGTTGNITPSTSTSGTYTVTYTVTASGGCSAVSGNTSVTITTAPVTPTISYSGTPFCNSVSTAQTVTQTGASGGTYGSTAGLSIDGTTGNITPSTSTAGTYTVTYTVAASAGCSAVSGNTSVTITTAPVTPTISYSGTPFCNSVSTAQTVTQTGASGGTYGSTAGLSIDGTTGNITPSTSTAGTYTVTYIISASGGCSAVSANTSVTITTAPVTPTISYSGTPFCTSVSSPQSVTQTGTSGGTYSSTAGLSIDGTTGNITPSTSTAGTYTVTYIISASGGCSSVNATTGVSIIAPPTATISGPSALCPPQTGLSYSATVITSAGYTWTVPSGMSITAGQGTNTITVSDDNTFSSGNVTVQVTGICPTAGPQTFYPVALSGSCNTTWTGASSTDWQDAGNWSNGVPVTGLDAIIPSGTSNNLIYATSGSVANLTIQSGATATFSSGTLSIYKNYTNNGTVSQTASSTIIFAGSTAQTITGNVDGLVNVNMASSNTVSLANSWNLNGLLRLVSGTFSTGGNAFTINPDNGGLIGYVSGDNGTISGNVSMNQSVVKYTHLLASPFSGVTSDQINSAAAVVPTGGQSRLYNYNFGTQAYVRITSLPTSIAVGSGYSMYFPTPATLTFTGTYDPNATYSYNFSSPGAGYYNLFGNPFAAPLDFSTITGSTSGLTSTLYYWNQAASAYATWNPVSGGTNSGTQYIPPMQAFFVVTSASGTSSIGYTKANLYNAAASPSYYRLVSSNDRISLMVSDTSGRSDETVIELNPSATNAFEPVIDAYKLLNPSPSSNLYTSIDTTDYAVNVLPPSTGTQIIPVSFAAGSDGTFSIQGNISRVSSGKTVFLRDKYLKKTVSLNDPYAFQASPSDGAARFELIVSDNNTSNSSGITFGSNEQTLFIISQGIQITNGTLYITDVTGKSLGSVKNVTVDGIAQVPLDNLSPGVYIVRLVAPDGTEYVGKAAIR